MTYFYPSVRRNVFISFYGGDEADVLAFTKWASDGEALIPRILHHAYNGEIVDSKNTDYVMRRIREDFIGDATVTMVLVGTCTHSRRYVDWELKASLQQGRDSLPNGLLAVALSKYAN